MIDLCKLFGVKEGEEFKIEYKDGSITRKYEIEENCLIVVRDEFLGDAIVELKVNQLKNIKNIIKLPKKKEFTDDELCILRNIDTKYKWLARDEYREKLYVYREKPERGEDRNWYSENWCRIGIYNHLFKCIQWRDEEPVFIDDYVERGVE